MHARVAWRIHVQQRVVVEPYLLGVDPGGRPLEGRGEGRQAGRHWVDRAGVQAAGLFVCWRVVAWQRMASRLWVGAIYRG